MKSFLAYMGGKSLLAKKIVAKMPKHDCYCEVFAGAIDFGKRIRKP